MNVSQSARIEPQYILSLTPIQRQRVAMGWAVRAFGQREAFSIEQRGVRTMEEGAEVAYVAGVPRELAHLCVDRVYDKEHGDMAQELGGLYLTGSILAERSGVDFQRAGVDELVRVLRKPLEHFRERNDAKNAMGLVAASLTR